MAAAAVVSASTGAMKPVLAKLTTLMGDEYKLEGLHNEVTSLQSELARLDAVLEKMDSGPVELDRQTKLCRRDMIEMSYDIEGRIDDFMERLGQTSNKVGIHEKNSQYLRTSEDHRHHLVNQFQKIKTQSMEARHRALRSQLDQSISITDPTRFISKKKKVMNLRSLAPYKECASLVGIGAQTAELVNWAMDKSAQQLKVKAIVGIGGLGKTTLAKEVYEKIKWNFDCKAFVSVSQDPNMQRVFMYLLIEFGLGRDCNDRETNHLINELKGHLQDKRYLIVVDDIWSTHAWKTLQLSLPENNCGSRIITTTRLYDVAWSCCGDKSSIYKMNPLSDEDSQKLFFDRVFGPEEQCPDYLKKAAKAILKRCRGLPLAIITISGLLADKRRTAEEWMKVCASMGAADNGTSNANTILSLSFYDLPSNLRTCMLYLSMFPEDYAIGREQLVWKWIAEGFIATEEGSTLEQVANSYFNQLINRNMIQAVDIQYDGTAKYCRVHDMMLELIISISDELNFSTIKDHKERKGILPPSLNDGRLGIVFPSQPRFPSIRRLGTERVPQKIYRLSHQSYRAKHALQNISSDSLSHTRSFILFGPVKEVPYLQKFKAMRVLDLGQCRSVDNNHIKIIVQLFLLKYLGLSYTKVTELPEEIGNLKHLLTLDLRECKISKMPATVARLQKLQNLLVCGGVTLPDDIGNMQSLELLLSIYLSNNSIKFIEELGKLVRMRRLEMTFGKPADMENEVRAYTNSLVSSLNKLANLETLNIQTGENSPLDSVKDICPTFFGVRKLVIGFISELPGWIGSLQSLVHLEVQVVTMKKEDLGILEGISTLIYLELKLNCAPKEMLIIGNQGFECLKELHLICLNDGIGLIFKAGAMPVLRKLHLGFLAQKALSKDDGVFNSIGNLSGLENLHAEVDCSGSTSNHVDAIEISFYSAAAKHPNKLTPDFQKVSEALMQWEEEVEEEEEEEEDDNDDEENEQFAIMTNLEEVTSMAPKILSRR